MNRTEYIAQCSTLTEQQLLDKVQAIRKRSKGRIPPEVQQRFRSLDDTTQVNELWQETSFGKTHLFLVSHVEQHNDPRPVLVNIHGGGWCLEHTERDIFFSRRMAMRTGCLVVDVDYVLAPEYPYPAAIEELEALFDALPDLLPGWGGDPNRIVFCGQSAGGNLLAAVAQRRKSLLYPLKQILCYPPADNCSDRFQGEELDPRGMDTELYGFFYNRTFEERKNPDVSMALLQPEDAIGLPPTDIITAGLDNLKDEAKRYYDILAAAGVPTSYRCFEHSRHGFLVNLYDECEACEDYVTDLILAALNTAS